MTIKPISLTRSQYGSKPDIVGVGTRKVSGKGEAKFPLSSSISGISNGNPVTILDSSTGIGYTEIHRFSYGVVEELYLWCGNQSGGNVNLTMSFGDNTFSGENIIVQLSGQSGLSLVYPGVPHQGNASNTQALYLRAGSASSLNAVGYVVRSYPLGDDPEIYGYHNSSAE